MGTLQASESIPVDQVSQRIPSLNGFRITVTTISGDKFTGQQLYFADAGYAVINQLSPWSRKSLKIPVKDLSRIELKRGRRTLDGTLDTFVAAAAPFAICAHESPAECVLVPIVVAPVVGVAVASLPVTLAIDGVELLIPPKVYEIIH